MITPLFSLDQDDEFVYINIKVPHIKAGAVHFEVSDNVFVFSLVPYYLRLRFPAQLIEDEKMSSNYDLEKSVVRCRISKLNKGEFFKDLGMLSKLLLTKQQEKQFVNSRKGPLIQEVDSSETVPGENDQGSDEDDEEIDFEIEQQLPTELEIDSQINYGFNNQYKDRVGLSMHAGNEINELDDPEKICSADRLQAMRTATLDQFDEDYYYADYKDDETIKELIRYELPTDLTLTDEMKDRLLKIGNRKYFLSNLKSTYLGLVPLIFAWTYDNRTNLGECTVESSWTIGKLAPSMCFLFNEYTSMKDIVFDCTERALTKPLYRNWNLIIAVWGDVCTFLSKGRSAILVIMVELLRIFETDIHFCYREILLMDYCIWLQYASDKVIASLLSELQKVLTTFKKSDVRLPLESTESLGDE